LRDKQAVYSWKTIHASYQLVNLKAISLITKKIKSTAVVGVVTNNTLQE